MTALDQWAGGVAGRLVDRDAAPAQYIYQCHDVWLDYLYEVIGGQPGDGHAPGDEGFTVEVWARFPHHRPRLATLFTKHYGSRGIRPGDVVFWPVGSANHPASHVVVALTGIAPNGTFECITQNPGPAVRATLSIYQVAGYLRPITDPMEEPVTQEEIQKIAEASARATVDRLLETKITISPAAKGQKMTIAGILGTMPRHIGTIRSRLATLLDRK
ncbi:hypothetical protein JOF28_001971 [Leucobacter exalbidus]|uniref:CHAP domain-containing protein n=1 Tax=Leucobacter exalbidus TaxID=662960 RepID=A0A940PWQ9_9MICO|nr:hypothetical protein [Leucobacter exalbidus]MBP1326739.1 hypothetical protein [Leucobacter exalbidus]